MSHTTESSPAILVVEDDDATREAECLLLRNRGYEVAEATDGREALDRLRSGLRPRAILLDLMLPVLDGHGLRAELLRDPELADIPVVVCSAAADLDRRAGELLPAAVLCKPVELERLAEAVRAAAGSTRPGVLVVQEDPDLCQLLGLILEREGFAVWSAPGGRAATQFYRLHRDQIAVVLLDAGTSGEGGPATLAALREIDPGVRAVFVSADPAGCGTESLLGTGAAAVLQKPFDLDELGRAVGRALACSRPEQQGAFCLSVRRAADLPRVLDGVAEAMTRLGFPGRDVFGVRLALEEALVNAIKHGNKDDPNKRVRVRYRVTAEEFWAEVEDEGGGFDPDAVADPLADGALAKPSGRGLLLMRNYLDEVAHNARGNLVRLRKRRMPAGAGPSEG
jgi:serine/threonine-protein kinase RsbW